MITGLILLISILELTLITKPFLILILELIAISEPIPIPEQIPIPNSSGIKVGVRF